MLLAGSRAAQRLVERRLALPVVAKTVVQMAVEGNVGHVRGRIEACGGKVAPRALIAREDDAHVCAVPAHRLVRALVKAEKFLEGMVLEGSLMTVMASTTPLRRRAHLRAVNTQRTDASTSHMLGCHSGSANPHACSPDWPPGAPCRHKFTVSDSFSHMSRQRSMALSSGPQYGAASAIHARSPSYGGAGRRAMGGPPSPCSATRSPPTSRTQWPIGRRTDVHPSCLIWMRSAIVIRASVLAHECGRSLLREPELVAGKIEPFVVVVVVVVATIQIAGTIDAFATFSSVLLIAATATAAAAAISLHSTGRATIFANAANALLAAATALAAVKFTVATAITIGITAIIAIASPIFAAQPTAILTCTRASARRLGLARRRLGRRAEEALLHPPLAQ